MKENDFFLPPKKKNGDVVLFMFLFFLLLPGFSIAQYKAQLNIDIKNGTLVNVFENIQKQSAYRFMYSNQDVAAIKNISVQREGVSVQEILDIVLKGHNLTYLIEDKIIFIKKQSQTTVTKIRGRVTDTKSEPLAGVTILIEGTCIGTTTDSNGNYVFTIPDIDKINIIYSFIGMAPYKVTYTGQENINVILKESAETMDEVVVTGYQTLRKSDVVGSVSTVKASDIMMPVYTSVDQMLQGRVAGMMVMNTSSRVGTSPKIRIRGTSTILGNQDPLWVVDGVIQPDPIPLNQNDLMVDDLKNILGNQISWLNPADIETVTVLKDASATAIYGSKAANGVIVITTKRGKQEGMTVNYNGTFSFRSRPHYGLFNLMNSQERIQFSREAFAAGAIYNEAPIASLNTYEGIMSMFYNKQITPQEAENAIHRLERTNTDWFDILTRNSFSHNHNLSVSGGSEKVIYNVSLGYSDQSGIEINNDAQNLSGRVNLGIRLHPKVHVDLSLVGSINKTWGYAANVSPLEYATETSRSVLAYNEDGSRHFQGIRTNYAYNENPVILGYNILNEIDHSYSLNKSSQINGNINFSWDILPWLKYEFVGGINNNIGTSEAYAGEQTYYIASTFRGYDFGSEAYGSEKYKAAILPSGGELYNGSSDVQGWNIQNKITFSKTFQEDHRLNVLIGTEVTSTKTANKSQKMFGYVKERGESVVKPTPLNELVPIGNRPAPGLGLFEELYNGNGWLRNTLTANQFSIFATLAYSFKNRYVINASMRNDASNRFGQDQNKRFDPTYSFGASWNVAQEPWLQNISNIINQFNLRASYGIQGNAVNSISPELILRMDEIKPYYGDYMSKISRIPNPHLSWERTKTWNFGLDIQVIRWISMNIEYYTKKSNNIVNQSIALEYGRVGTEVNGGRVVNSGVEYTLNITPIRTKDWAWTIGFNSSKNWNKAKTQSISEISLQDYISGFSDKVLKEGFALSSFWSYDFKRLSSVDGSPEFNRLFQEDAQGNILKGEDGAPLLKGVNEYTDMLVYSGKMEPDFTGGLTTRLRWKGLTFGANFSLLLGAKKRLPNPYPNLGNIPLSNVNLSKDLINRWKKPGDEAYTYIPGVYTGRIANYWRLQDDRTYNMYQMWGESDIMVAKADFLRCQQISLTWTANDKICTKMRVKSFSINAIMNNVFVVADKKFHGFDPELGDSVQPKTYSFGITVGF